jgi:hypothetical protein
MPTRTARQDHPRLVRHRDRNKNRIDCENNICELHFDDRGPERAQPQHRPRRFGRAPVVSLFTAIEMRIREVQQVSRTRKLHPAQLDKVDGQQGRKRAEEEGAQDAIPQRFFLLMFRKPEHENGQNQGVIST